jgi:ubiquinone/menaquinone biosynthesis C-methylase UbiE
MLSPQAPDFEYDAMTYFNGVNKILARREETLTPFFMHLVGDIAQEDVLDLACGYGDWTSKLRKITTGQVVGVDICDDMIKKAEELKGA